jgi:hypothetical protein
MGNRRNKFVREMCAAFDRYCDCQTNEDVSYQVNNYLNVLFYTMKDGKGSQKRKHKWADNIKTDLTD